MTINLLSQPRRSLGALRRAVCRTIVVTLATIMLSGFLTCAARTRTRFLQSQMPPGDGLIVVSLSSQIAACSAEKASLKRAVEIARDNGESWRRPQGILDALAKVLPSEIWLQKMSITDKEIEIVGVARTADEVERFVSSQEVVRHIEQARIVSTRTDRGDGRRVFQLFGEAPPSLGHQAQEGVVDELG